MTEDEKFYIDLLKSSFAESDYGWAVIDECVKAVNEAPLEDWVYEALKGKNTAESEYILQENKVLNLKALLIILNKFFQYFNSDSEDLENTVYEINSFNQFKALLELYTQDQSIKETYQNKLLIIVNKQEDPETEFASISEVDFDALNWTNFYDVYDTEKNPLSDVIHELIDKKVYSCLHMLKGNTGPIQLFLMLHAMTCEEQVQKAMFGSEYDYIHAHSKTALDKEYFALGAEYRDRCVLTVDAIKQSIKCFYTFIRSICENTEALKFLEEKKL